MAAACIVLIATSVAAMRCEAVVRLGERHLDTGWRFMLFPGPDAEVAGAAELGFDDSGWRKVRLPHDWGVERPFRMDVAGKRGRLAFFGLGWYRTKFRIADHERDGRVFLDFGGAMSCATVYVNGRKMAFRPFGFGSFSVDATEALVPGEEQILAVRLDNREASSRWYHGGGLYRRVKVVPVPEFHIAVGGLRVTSSVSNGMAAVHAEIRTAGDDVRGGEATATIRREGCVEPVAQCKGVKRDMRTDRFEFDAKIENPALWSDESPALYEIEVRLSRGGRADTLVSTFGIRNVELIPDRGMFVNGRRVKMRGVCQHSDTGALGVASYRRAFERQLEILKDMGCNAVRTAHNPPSEEFLDLCDRMGFYVIDEAFDMWEMFKFHDDGDLWAKWFPDWWARDLTDFVRRDRNHPCVVMWSIGNEVREQKHPADAIRIGNALASLVRMEDPTRPVTMANVRERTITNGLARVVDVFGCNYMPWRYGDFYRHNPGMGMVATETDSMVSTRDTYFFPDDAVYDTVKCPDWSGMFDFQVSSYDRSSTRFNNYSPETEFAAQRAFPQCYGSFTWTGFDYLGEPHPADKAELVRHFRFTSPEAEARWRAFLADPSNPRSEPPGRSSYYGAIDLCGFPKDRFYMFQTEWRPGLPMAHLLPHWTWPGREGKVTPVHAYTTGDEAELFLNGRSLGRRKKGDAFRLMWNDVRYEPGELVLVAYKNGAEWARAFRRTAGAAIRLVASCDRVELKSLQDLSYVKFELLDEHGTVVPESDVELRFKAEGAVEVAGVCNGDPTDLTGLQADRQRTFHGLCQAVVRAKEGCSGPGRLVAEGGGFSAHVEFIFNAQQ